MTTLYAPFRQQLVPHTSQRISLDSDRRDLPLQGIHLHDEPVMQTNYISKVHEGLSTYLRPTYSTKTGPEM